MMMIMTRTLQDEICCSCAMVPDDDMTTSFLF